ncbi:MAG: TonB-dependent receptor domain-containing protein [Moheibacter sp.]
MDELLNFKNKEMYRKSIYIFLMLFGLQVLAQEKTEEIRVEGECGMCKARIENAVKEIKSADGTWDENTKVLTLSYNPEKTTLEAIMKNVAKVGHDNELFKAEDETYKNLPSCCLYKRLEPSEEVEVENVVEEKETQIKVRGNCGSCKARIEAAVAELPSAVGNWNIETKILSLQFDDNQTSLNEIMQNVAKAGHDNELYTAEDAVYDALPGCCLYDRVTDWAMIENSEGTHLVEAESEDDSSFFDTEDDVISLEKATITNSKAATSLNKKAAGLEITISDKELLKAACCNLSESFETNATVDVSYANAVSGAKQLKMLGLDQKYILLTKELLPEIRGISSAYGLQFIPGRWIQSIQLVKGAGSVTNGYESIAGHINTELYKSQDKAKTSLNFFGDTNARFEGNFVHNDKINEKWAQSILLHGNATVSKQDHNNDGFMDQPVGRGINLSYLLNYNDLDNSGLGTHFGVNYINDHRLGGQVDFNEKADYLTTNAYGIGIDIQRFQFWNKTGYVFEGRPYQSLGWMNQFTYHEQDSYFGLRTYDAEQKTFYSNLIFESIINNTAHKYKTGLSFLYDNYNEYYNLVNYKRDETVPGAFAEYTYTGDKLTLVAGARVDFHNLAGTQFTPRLNIKYDIARKTILRASAGRGFRTANVFAESQAFLASNRQIEILEGGGDIYGLNPEIAWNYGVSLQQEFKLFGRKSSVVADFFRTDFTDQVVLDLDNSPQKIMFYNLDGKSYANSFQVQWDFQPVRRLEARLAYKYYNTETDYLSGKKQLPFTPEHRGFMNLSYTTSKKLNGSQWSFDTTLQWIGEQRLPDTSSNPLQFQSPEYGDSFFQLNVQVSYNFNKIIRLYLGGENLLSYTQDSPIVDVQNPFSNYFDGGMVYAPIMPTNFYIGLDIDF